jgi:excinuclease UvrABC ATPase subunit
VQGFMPTLTRPEVDVLEGLTTAISVDQERMGTDPRSTVGTATDANAMLRIPETIGIADARRLDHRPGAGQDGGRIVFEGTPADLVAARSTLTGEHLAAYVGT